MYQILKTKIFVKEYKKLPNNIKKLVDSKIELLAKDPDILKNNITQLVGYENNIKRLRVGDYRIFFRIYEKKIIIELLKISPRGSAYKN